MRLDKVMDEVAQALEQITGLRVFAYPPETLVPPAGYVSYPQSVDFDEAYQRGEDRFTDLPIVLLASKVTTRAARDTVTQWASGDGPKSVKRALEAWTWTTCDDLTVTSCEFDVEKVGGVSYLAAMFKATVVGPGEED
ncbi:hypothetical protein ACIBSW_13160 [Actinoplanes sp. NPDC049668]|uniref:hypothetical protein n=1 Tax=unclassified Actinoplanes TaxID=2626549 RepID=UPI0033A38D1E